MYFTLFEIAMLLLFSGISLFESCCFLIRVYMNNKFYCSHEIKWKSKQICFNKLIVDSKTVQDAGKYLRVFLVLVILWPDMHTDAILQTRMLGM